MTRPYKVDIFQCRGTAYEVGLQLAQQFRKTPRGRAFGRRRERRPFAFSLANARHTLETHAPNIWEELHGLADGLAIPLERAVAEFSNGRLRYPRRGCSALMTNGLYARNYDYDVSRYDRTLIATQAAGCHAHIGFADRFTGRLDGMNQHGLCVGLHYVDDKTWQPGLVCILIVRVVLDQCATTAEAITLLRRLPHGLGYNYSLMDASGRAAVVEAAPGGIAVREGDWLACTNHFQAAEMQACNRPAIGSSRKRLPPLEAWARQGLDAAALFRALNASDSPAFHHGYTKGFGTLHSMVCEPADRRMRIGIGGDADPVASDVAAWAGGEPLGFDTLEGQLGGTAQPFDPNRRPMPARKARTSTVARGVPGAHPDARFSDANLADACFDDVNLGGASFTNINLAGARFDDINFANAEITGNCNFQGMRIAGIPVTDLFAAYYARKAAS